MSTTTEHSVISADGTSIGYLRAGDGPALVIAHGSIATAEQWLPALEHLAQHFTCYVHDRRGRGRSIDSAPYDIGKEVEDIAAVMGEAGPGAHLLAHSYGALCALAYAEREGLDGGTLLLFEPPLAVDGPIAGEKLADYAAAVDSGDLDQALEIALVNFVRVPPEAIPMIRTTPLWTSCRPLTPTWTRELEQIDLLGDDLTHYAAITAPTHLVAGDATTPFLLESARRLSGIIPGAGLTVLPGGDHFAHVADPAGFAEAVRDAVGQHTR